MVFDLGGAGPVTNSYGIYINNIVRGATLNYAIYSGGGKAYFAGNMSVGGLLSDAKLHVQAGNAQLQDGYGWSTNLYYASGWKYSANGSGWNLYSSGSGLVTMIVAPSNAGGAGAAATSVTALTVNQTSGAMIFNTAPTVGLIASQDVIQVLPATSATRFTGTITPADLTADKTWTFPNLTGQVALVGSAIQNGAAFDATAFSVAGAAGADCASAANVTVAKGIVTGCTAPIATPEQLLGMIADLRAEIAALKARQ